MTLRWNSYMINVRLKWQKVSPASDSWDVWALKINLQRLVLHKKAASTSANDRCVCVCERVSVRERERNAHLFFVWTYVRWGCGCGWGATVGKGPPAAASWTWRARLSVSAGPRPSSGSCPSRRGLPPSGAWPKPWGHWTTAAWMRWEEVEEVGDPEWWRRRRGETFLLVYWSIFYFFCKKLMFKFWQKIKCHTLIICSTVGCLLRMLVLVLVPVLQPPDGHCPISTPAETHRNKQTNTRSNHI